MLKTWHKQLLGSLPLAFALPGVVDSSLQGGEHLTGENLTVVWAELSAQS
jgi:hypothetical protein